MTTALQVSEPISSPRAAPGPRGTHIVTDVLRAWRDPLALMDQRAAEYGDVFLMRFAWMRYFVVNHPDAVHHVLVENHRAYVKSRNYQGVKFLLGQGLLTSEGEFWRKQRKLAQPAFHRERLLGLAAEMVTCTEDMLRRWESDLLAERPVFDLHREMMRLTLRIVGKTLFSTDLDGESREIGDALSTAIEWANHHVNSVLRIPPSVPTPNNLRFRRAQRTIDRIAQRLISERRSSGRETADLLGMLMSAKDELTGEGMSDQQLKDELLTLVLAGHETTANGLSFTFHLLSHHPEIEQKLFDEVHTVLGDRPIQLSDLPKMPYTKMVIEESMRLFPPAWAIERDSIQDDVVMGFRIPKHSVVGVLPWLLHRHPKYWPEPHQFDPERFRPEVVEARPKHVYLPFGGGPRMCIGNMFALMEMQLILPLIVRRLRVREEPGFKLELDPTITLRPRNGMSARIERRAA